jgi:hypothetical protein
MVDVCEHLTLLVLGKLGWQPDFSRWLMQLRSISDQSLEALQ